MRTAVARRSELGSETGAGARSETGSGSRSTLRRSLLVAASLVALLSPAHAQPAPTAAKPAAAPAPIPASPRATTAETAAADALLARWLAAQNDGDFAAYQALYAPSFTGVKRVGKQTKKLDRAAWMKDRRSMFKAAMLVTATQRAYGRDLEGFYVELTQHWEQGSFADVGKKRLRLDLGTGLGPGQPTAAVTILAEEMLSSRVLPTEDACVRALFPAARAGRIDATASANPVRYVEVIDLGNERFVCRVEHGAAGERDGAVVLGVIKRGRGWSVIDERSYEVRAKGPSIDDPDQTDSDATLHLQTLQISPREQALLVEEESRAITWMTDDGTRSAELLRVTPDGFVSVLEYKSTWSRGEADDRTTCELQLSTRQTRGTFDATVRCVTVAGRWHSEDPKENGETTTEEVRRYRWNGSRYAT